MNSESNMNWNDRTDPFETLIEDEAYQEVYQKAIALLSRRNHFEAELKKKLLQREYDKRIVERVLEELSEKKYLDDLENARIYIEFRKNSKSIYYLKNKLYEKGVSSSIVNEVLEEMEIDEFSIALKHVYKKLHWNEEEEFDLSYEEVAKICRSLSSKGFSYRTVSQIRDYLL